MKRFFAILSLAALCLTACDCPDCGDTVSLANVNAIFVTKTPGGDFNLDPEKIIIQSSCNWTATNLTPQYLDFANTNGTGGVHHLPIGLTPEFYAALAADINNFPVDATGDRKIGSVHFDSDCDAGFDVHVYLKGVFVLHFELNGGVGITPPDMAFVPGEDLLIPASTGMTYSPKTFVGWGSRSDGKGSFYKDGRTATFSGNTTLHALWEGDGSSEEGPKYIYNRTTLLEVHATAGNNLHYLVIADFDANFNEITGERFDTWVPIGRDRTGESRFRGVFDGNGHHITYVLDGTEIDYEGAPSYEYELYASGLFGRVTGTETIIKNLVVSGSVYGIGYGGNTGGIVGVLFQGSITHCVSMCTVIHEQPYGSSGEQAGGIVGSTRDGTIVAYCVSTGSVTCKHPGSGGSGNYAYAGGITGNNGGVTYCISTSTVRAESTGRSYAGGISGGSYYTATEGLIESNVALNRLSNASDAAITSVGNTVIVSYAGRIVGTESSFTTRSNYALSAMLVQQRTDPAAQITTGTLNDINGENVLLAGTQNRGWWESIGFTDANWDFTQLASNGHPLPKQ